MHEHVISITTPSLRDLCTAALPEHDSATITPLVSMQSFLRRVVFLFTWGYGATAARLTPDQKVGSSNLSALICISMQVSHSHPMFKAAQFPPAPFRVDGACEVSHFQMALSPASVDGAAANSSELAAQVLVLILQN